MRFQCLPVIASACIAASCAPSTTNRSQSELPRESGGDYSFVKMPVLRSAYLDKNWGLPDVTIREDGGYRLTYRQGTTLNYVFIHGLAKPQPAAANPPDWTEEVWNDKTGAVTLAHHKQAWREATILGTPVKWYQNDGGGGADFPCYKTADFTLTAPDGRTGSYRIEVCTTSAGKAADWITRVNW